MLQLAAQMIALQIVVLLLIRPLLLWYFRINELRAILLSIDETLKLMNGRAVRASMARKAS